MTDKIKGENDAADNDESDFKSGVSRRDIMKVGAITAATLAAPTILLNQGAKSMADAQKDKYEADLVIIGTGFACLLYTSPSPRDQRGSRMPSSA